MYYDQKHTYWQSYREYGVTVKEKALQYLD